MDGYYERIEQQLRELTKQGAHRRRHVRATPAIAIAAATVVALIVGGAFLGVRSHSGAPGSARSPASPAPACARADWRMSGIPAQRLDGATVAGVSITAATRCRLRVTIAFDLINRSGAVAGGIGAKVDTTLAPGAAVQRLWAWRNGCGEGGGPRWWFRLNGGGRTVRVPVPPPPCVNRHDTTGFGLFELHTVAVLGGRGIGPARFGERTGPALEAISSLLGVFGDRSSGRGCGVERTERLLDGALLFFGHGHFVGYEYSGRFLATTAGLRVGDTLRRARRLYGTAFRTSTAQGGSWSAAGMRGHLSALHGGRIATIDAGNVGCPALSP